MSPDALREIGLVSCVKNKQDEPAPPKELYTSDYFQKMRRYAEREHHDWWILSAKHGLLDPDGEAIDPYDETLTGAQKAKQRKWAESVFTELDRVGLLDEDIRLVIHAGRAYYGELLPHLSESEVGDISIPTEGMQIGETLAWYKERL